MEIHARVLQRKENRQRSMQEMKIRTKEIVGTSKTRAHNEYDKAMKDISFK